MFTEQAWTVSERGDEMAKNSVSREMLLDGAQMMLLAMTAGTMGFLKERGISIKEWVSYIGDAFEGSLEGLDGEPVDKVMQHLLGLGVLPTGVEIVSSKPEEDSIEVVLTSSPSGKVLEKFGTTPKELLKGFGITQTEFESIYAMHEPAVKAIGMSFKHHLKGGQEILSLERKPRSGSAAGKR